MTAERFCPVCKSLNPVGALRCIVCHASFENAPPPITTAPVANAQPELGLKPSAHLQQLAQLPADALVLFIMDHEQPLIIRNTEQVILGRSETEAAETICDLTPFGAADLGVSRMHALITIRPEGCTITDLRSTNGTWLNERRLVSHKPYDLQGGDRLRLGNLRIYPYLRAAGDSEAASEQIVHLTEAPLASVPYHPRITPRYLYKSLSLYLQALSDLQAIIDESSGRAPREMEISTISALRQDLPIGVSLSGAPDAIRLLKTLILPWRANHASQIVQLQGVRYLPNEMEGGAAVSPGAAPTGELNPNFAHHVRVPPDSEPAQTLPPELQADLTLLAEQLLASVAPHLDVPEKSGYSERLLHPLTLLATARLQPSTEGELGGPEVDR